MANTKQGIYYQDDYSLVADVPSDMKKMAESIDTELETDRGRLSTTENNIQSLQSGNTTNKQDISNIKTEQTTQNANIETLTQRLNEKDEQIAELEDKVSDLNNNQIHGKASGEYVHLVDSAKMNCEIAVLGNSKQETREGYNLFNKDKITENKYVDMSKGILVNSSVTNTSDYIEVKANETYIFVYEYSTLLNENDRSYCMFDTDKNYLSGDNYAVKEKKIIFNPTQDGYIRISFDKNLTDIMFYKGTEDKEYEPYGAMPSLDYPSEIECVSSANVKVCNKNLLQVTETANTTVAYSSIARGNATLKKGKTYTISFDTNNNGGRVYMQGNEFGFYKEFSCNGQRQTYTFTMTIDKTLQNNFILQSKIATEVAYDIKNIQIEESTTATDYITHEEQNYFVDMQEPFKAIGDVRDCFVLKEDGKWYERHKIGGWFLNGTEKWVKGGASTDDFYVFQSNGWILPNDTNIGTLYCNKLKNIGFSSASVSYDYENIGLNSDKSVSKSRHMVRIWIKASRLENTDINTFLAENPLIVYFALETPTDIECTETQTRQLQALLKAKTYKNITNITTDTIAVLDVDYKRDLETYQKQQDDRITAIEQLLSTTTTSAMLLDNVQSDLESEVQ